jgi:hypothetical protein
MKVLGEVRTVHATTSVCCWCLYERVGLMVTLPAVSHACYVLFCFAVIKVSVLMILYKNVVKGAAAMHLHELVGGSLHAIKFVAECLLLFNNHRYLHIDKLSSK